MQTSYTVYAGNLYAVAATLVHLRIPFSFVPHKAFKSKKFKSPYGKSIIQFDLDDCVGVTIANILYEMHEKYNNIFGFEILQEVKYASSEKNNSGEDNSNG